MKDCKDGNGHSTNWNEWKTNGKLTSDILGGKGGELGE